MGSLFLGARSLPPSASVKGMEHDLESTIRRLRHSLTHEVGKPQFAASIVRTATQLTVGGLYDDALSLAAQTEALFEDPAQATDVYGEFFNAMVHAGQGHRRVARFGAPRWQDHLGIDPQHVTCADLARRFPATPVPRGPHLAREMFAGTCLDALDPVIEDTLAFPAPGMLIDEQLAAYARILWAVPGTPHGITLPDWVTEDMEQLHFAAVFSNETSALENTPELVARANNTAASPRERAFWELSALMMVLLNRSPEHHPAAYDVAVRALPLVLHAGRGDEQQRTCYLLAYSMHMSLVADYGRTHALHSVLDYLVGLSTAGSGDYADAAGFHTVFSVGGRRIDAIALLHRAHEMLEADPGAVKDPAQARIDYHRSVALSFERLGCHASAGEAALRGAEVARTAGYVSAELDALTLAADNYWHAHDFDRALDAYNATHIGKDTRPGQRCAVLASGLRLVSIFSPEELAQHWPESFGAYQAAVEAAVGEEQEQPAAVGVCGMLLEDILPILIERQELARAHEFTSWVGKTFGGAVPRTPVHATLQFEILSWQASVLAYSGMHDEAALVLESYWQRARRAGDPEREELALGRLRRFAANGASPAYQRVLDGLGF